MISLKFSLVVVLTIETRGSLSLGVLDLIAEQKEQLRFHSIEYAAYATHLAEARIDVVTLRRQLQSHIQHSFVHALCIVKQPSWSLIVATLHVLGVEVLEPLLNRYASISI